MFDPELLKEHSLGFKATRKDQAAIETLRVMGQPIPILYDNWLSMEGKECWVWVFGVPMLGRKPYVLHIPSVILAISSTHSYDENWVCFDNKAVSKDAWPENRLKLQFYGTSWFAYMENPIPEAVNQIVDINLFHAVPKFLADTKSEENVTFNYGVGVKAPNHDFPIQIGHTYWLVPQRDDFGQYHADFSLLPMPNPSFEVFLGYPLNPVPIPFTVMKIELSEWGTSFQMRVDQEWLLNQKDWMQCSAEIPIEYPNIFQTEQEALEFAAKHQDWS